MMNTLDIAILAMLGIFTLLGVYWGLIRQILALTGLVVGIIVAGRYGPNVADWLSSFIADPGLANAIGFIGLVLLVSAIASLIASLLHTFVGLLFFSWLDHLLGGLLGLAQALIAAAAILIGMITFPHPLWAGAVDSSLLAGFVLRVGTLLTPLLPQIFRDALTLTLGSYSGERNA
jgi:membrane protein required for colicin V production